jgi:hypothetical protein
MLGLQGAYCDTFRDNYKIFLENALFDTTNIGRDIAFAKMQICTR